jgi:hypothetical protein
VIISGNIDRVDDVRW